MEVYTKDNLIGGLGQLFATSWLGLFEIPITVDKRLRYASPKFASQTSFIRETLGEIVSFDKEEK